ncbi:hypothetical protein F8M41_009182 [Gigaspora margarita]|uniref:F-box domain-containing protein n=1 Tax=Gigaspora margarita TaxID=4874 RepID=A0A8H4A390_GIGMA|nr:hypothetical protein F8M41_009182 [Gigaspora margarita]
MITLPEECYYIIFNNLRPRLKNLFSCALVNRYWCRIVIPILWNDPKDYLKDIRLIEILLLSLNSNEQILLIPFKISLPNYQKPLFEYTSYITNVNDLLDLGIIKWLRYKKYHLGRELANAMKSSLVVMFLRTSKNLSCLTLNEIICNQIIFEKLYENSNVTSLDLYNVSDDFKSKTINALAKLLYENPTLTSVDLFDNKIDIEDMKEVKH